MENTKYYISNRTKNRIGQLTDLRNVLNLLGDWFYANPQEHNAFCVLDRNETWNKRRVVLRNRINLRLSKIIDQKIGNLCRNGKTIFYAFPNCEYKESARFSEIFNCLAQKAA